VSYLESVAQRLVQGSPIKRTDSQADEQKAILGPRGTDQTITVEVLGLKTVWLVLLALLLNYPSS